MQPYAYLASFKCDSKSLKIIKPATSSKSIIQPVFQGPVTCDYVITIVVFLIDLDIDVLAVIASKTGQVVQGSYVCTSYKSSFCIAYCVWFYTFLEHLLWKDVYMDVDGD